MEEKISKEKVLNLLQKKKEGLSFTEIAKRLRLEEKEMKALRKLLKKLKKKGVISLRDGRYFYGEEEVVKGEVIAYPAGFGFLKVEGRQKDIYIPPFEMEKVFHGDIVRAEVVEFKGKKEIRILRVLKRAKKSLVCRLVPKKKVCYAFPVDENAHQVISLDKKECEGIKEGTLVVVEIKKFPTHLQRAYGRIAKVLGHPQEKNLVVEIIVHKYNLPTDYPPEVIKEVERIEVKLEEELKRRKDLRDQLCFTIDPERARDYDDAVAIEKTPDGNYRLWVHIADVSFFVERG